MADRTTPQVYSIAAHRGFADALVAGIVPRHSDPVFGLAKLTLLLPSSRTARTFSEAFIRYFGEHDLGGMLMPRMVMIGDLDLDESLGALLDPLGSVDIAPAVEPTRRWLELAEIIREELASQGQDAPAQSTILRMSREFAATMDRLLVEEVEPRDLLDENVLNLREDLSQHWKDTSLTFTRVLVRWNAWLEENGLIDAARRRNLLFDRAAEHWRNSPPNTPVIAAGVTSAAPALARLLRVISELPSSMVVLPDLDLALGDEAWDELGRAGQPGPDQSTSFAGSDAVTHPQYHLKLLLNRMGVNRGEVQHWHRKGASASEPERSHAVSSLFLPPKASSSWVDLAASKRRLPGLTTLETETAEEEALAIGYLVREALETPEKRVAIVTPDRNLARRVSQQLERWGVSADDTAGRPLDTTATGRLFLLLGEIAAHGPLPVPLISALAHPLVQQSENRGAWLSSVRKFERRLRGPRPQPGLSALAAVAKAAGEDDWWAGVSPQLEMLAGMARDEEIALTEALNHITAVAEELAGLALWKNEDGRALSACIDDLRAHAQITGTTMKTSDLPIALREAFNAIAVRPPYGGHPRVAIYGLLESRMTRADLVICGGLNEGTWPRIPGPEPLLAPAMLRALGVPAGEFRIGLAAHDLAGALGAPEVVLTRAQRDGDGPTIPSRFLLRIEALLGDKAGEHRDTDTPRLARLLDRDVVRADTYARPMPDPDPKLRNVPIAVTALDRLLGDPYQFYARSILALKVLDPLDGDVTSDPAWQGTLAHKIIDEWHRRLLHEPDLAIAAVAEETLARENAHPMLKGLWLPRLLEGLKWVEEQVRTSDDRKVFRTELDGSMDFDGVRVFGRADRIDHLDDGSLAVVDYKTGKPPSAAQVEAGFALQLGLLGLIARHGEFSDKNGASLSGDVSVFEYWSLAKKAGDFGYVDVPMKVGRKSSGIEPDQFLPRHEQFLREAIEGYIKGRKPFTAKLNPDYPGYADYDQLMRLDEWQIALADEDDAS